MGMTGETVRCESCPKFFTCSHVFAGECKIVEPETKEYIEIIRCRNCRFWKSSRTLNAVFASWKVHPLYRQNVRETGIAPEQNERKIEMKHSYFAGMKFTNGSIMYVNSRYITGYGYVKEQHKTAVSILGEGKEVYFPGDQTKEILAAINEDEIPDDP